VTSSSPPAIASRRPVDGGVARLGPLQAGDGRLELLQRVDVVAAGDHRDFAADEILDLLRLRRALAVENVLRDFLIRRPETHELGTRRRDREMRGGDVCPAVIQLRVDGIERGDGVHLEVDPQLVREALGELELRADGAMSADVVRRARVAGHDAQLAFGLDPGKQGCRVVTGAGSLGCRGPQPTSRAQAPVIAILPILGTRFLLLMSEGCSIIIGNNGTRSPRDVVPAMT
jgi:hypothetical protein